MELVGDDGVLDQEFEGDDPEGVLVGGFEDDGAGGSGLEDLQPACGADAPAISGFEAGEAVLGHGGGEVVAEAFGGGEEVVGDDTADGVYAEIVSTGVAAAITVEAGHGIAAAGGEGLAEDVFGGGLLGFGGGHGWVVLFFQYPT